MRALTQPGTRVPHVSFPLRRGSKTRVTGVAAVFCASCEHLLRLHRDLIAFNAFALDASFDTAMPVPDHERKSISDSLMVMALACSVACIAVCSVWNLDTASVKSTSWIDESSAVVARF